MQKKELKTFREKSLDILTKEAADLKLKIEKGRLDIKLAKEKNLKKVKNLTRDLSQILTIIREKEIMEKIESSTKRKGESK